MKMPTKCQDNTELPLKIPFFQVNLSNIPTDRLKEYSDMLEELSYCIDTDSPATVDVWKVISRMGCLLRGELYDRNNKARDSSKSRSNRTRAKNGPAVIKKRVVKPLKARK